MEHEAGSDDPETSALDLDETSEAEKIARWLFPTSVKVTVVPSAAPTEEDDEPNDDFIERHHFEVRGSCDTRPCLPRTGRPTK